jgi:hypothetical protein
VIIGEVLSFLPFIVFSRLSGDGGGAEVHLRGLRGPGRGPLENGSST